MAAVAELKAAGLSVNRLIVAGRVEDVKDFEGADGLRYYTVIAMEAPDKYSKPGIVEVESKRRVGRKGEEVSVACRVDGWIRNFKTKNNEAGTETKNKFVALED